MTSQSPKKRYFKPEKPVNQMTDEELDAFAASVFDRLLGDIEDDGRNDDESR
jgi:hypothetical protein